jgi:hypothetical protein
MNKSIIIERGYKIMENINDTTKWCVILQNDNIDVYMYTEPCDRSMHQQYIYLSAVHNIISNKSYSGLITFDSYLLSFEKYVQDFLIFHEVGHITLGHAKNISKAKSKLIVFLRACGICPKMEFDADVYAASIVGKKDAKSALIQLIKSRLYMINKVEILLRWIILSLRPIKNNPRE